MRYTGRSDGDWDFLGQIVTVLMLDVVRVGYREDNQWGMILREFSVLLTHY